MVKIPPELCTVKALRMKWQIRKCPPNPPPKKMACAPTQIHDTLVNLSTMRAKRVGVKKAKMFACTCIEHTRGGGFSAVLDLYPCGVGRGSSGGGGGLGYSPRTIHTQASTINDTAGWLEPQVCKVGRAVNRHSLGGESEPPKHSTWKRRKGQKRLEHTKTSDCKPRRRQLKAGVTKHES